MPWVPRSVYARGRRRTGFLIGLAALGLFSSAAERKPLVFLIDDLHWLDRTSSQALAFVARRLDAESVAVIMATRVLHPD